MRVGAGTGTHVQPAEERLPRAHRFLEDQDDGSDSEPDRNTEEELRTLPADEPPRHRARGRGPAVGVQVRLPDQRLPGELVARVHRVLHRQLGVQVQQAPGPAAPAQALHELRAHAGRRSVRRQGSALPELRHGQHRPRRRLRHLRPDGRDEAEVRRRRVPGARHDLRRAAQGHHPARGLEQGPGDRGEDHPRHQGAGGLLRRHPADDRARHVHHQRHRARHRQPAAPVAGRVLPLRGQDPLHRADHPVSRVVGGVRVRHQEPAVRPHRPQAQVPGVGVPARARPAQRRRDHPRVLHGGPPAPEVGLGVLGRGRQPGRPARQEGDQGPRRRGDDRRGQEDHRGGDRGAAGRPTSRRSRSSTTRWKARLRPPTSSIRPPARCCSRPTRS